jgi:RNA 2',3'-cyclic 3'-phosphodiesterase
MDERWRVFVAVPIGEELRRDLAEAVAAWKRLPELEGLRWTDPADWHLTLAFLGATAPDAIPGLIVSLATVTQAHEPMELATGGLGAFPSRRRARVAWYGVADPEHRLARLADAVRAAMGVVAGSPFRAHLTVGRARRDPLDLRSWIDAAQPPRGGLAVDGVQLMRSHLGGRRPARYEVIASATLGVPAHV